jgi:hypothetical protein
MKNPTTPTRSIRSCFLSIACAALLGCGPGADATGSGGGTGSSTSSSSSSSSSSGALVPHIVGDWWQVAGEPDLGALTTAGQQPVDFGVWQASDHTWQLWSCIRFTKEPGNTRLFHRWEGKSLTDPDWQPMGIAMHADTSLGETAGGLQAPFVMKTGSTYEMFYGDWEHICRQTSTDGKTFTRVIGPDGKTGMFGEGAGANTRDPMVLPIGDTFYAYYTASPGGMGADYVRTSKDLATWSAPTKIASGGQAGTGPSSAECPFVVYRADENAYFLFRTQRYGEMAQTSVYRSEDPTKFGVDDDSRFVETLPVAAPEIFEHDGQWFIAALLPSLKGIHISHLDWVAAP